MSIAEKRRATGLATKLAPGRAAKEPRQRGSRARPVTEPDGIVWVGNRAVVGQLVAVVRRAPRPVRSQPYGFRVHRGGKELFVVERGIGTVTLARRLAGVVLMAVALEDSLAPK